MFTVNMTRYRRGKAPLEITKERVVSFHPELAEVLDGIEEALFWEQLYYWSDKGKRPDGFIYKTKEEIQKETYLTRTQQDRVRKKLVNKGLLEIKIHRANGSPTIHYKVNVEEVNKLLRLKQLSDIAKAEFPDLLPSE